MEVAQLSEQVHTLLVKVHELEGSPATSASPPQDNHPHTRAQDHHNPQNDAQMLLLEKDSRVLQLEERLQVSFLGRVLLFLFPFCN